MKQIDSLVLAAVGYGALQLSGCSSGTPPLAVAPNARAEVYARANLHVLYSFQNGSDGAQPQTALLTDASGNLYGTSTNLGGRTECSASACGTVFELSPPTASGGRWSFRVLYAFTGGLDGGLPRGTLIFGPNGSLYGTTNVGGAYDNNGVAFQLKASRSGFWTETVLHNFGQGNDGADPTSGLVSDKHGNLYGTTALGGASCGRCGVVYELSPPALPSGAWTETVLHTFVGGPDGFFPMAGLTLGRGHHLFGTTEFGGYYSSFCQSGCGTVFELTPPAPHRACKYAVIHRFVAGRSDDGALPLDSLTSDPVGNLYGTTFDDQSREFEGGTAFELSPPTARGRRWTETVLYRFPQYEGDAAFSSAGLLLDEVGNLYGVSFGGGAQGKGAAFLLLKPAESGDAWTDLILHSFRTADGGATYPSTNLIFGAGGALYGTTPSGGTGPCHLRTKGCGTIFTIRPQ
jgi:hypothetical protein